MICNPKGCARVVGGRSEAKTSGIESTGIRTQKECQKSLLLSHPFRVQMNSFPPRSGGLTTTGYSLAALQAAASLTLASVTRHLRSHIPHEFQLREGRQLFDRQTTDDQLRSLWIEHNFKPKLFQLCHRLC